MHRFVIGGASEIPDFAFHTQCEPSLLCCVICVCLFLGSSHHSSAFVASTVHAHRRRRTEQREREEEREDRAKTERPIKATVASICGPEALHISLRQCFCVVHSRVWGVSGCFLRRFETPAPHRRGLLKLPASSGSSKFGGQTIRKRLRDHRTTE